MALPSISTPKVKTVNKDLEAWIRLPALEEGEHYTIEYLHDVLRVNQITYGIDEAQLQKILDEEIYEQDVLVARGIPAVEGQDGFYEYKVNMNLEKKPKILPDGSVDYWSRFRRIRSLQYIIRLYREQTEPEFPESRFLQRWPENREHFAELVLDEVRIPLPIFR